MTTPDFNPAYRIARCGQSSAHRPHVVEHGPDQPRNCPGTGDAPAHKLREFLLLRREQSRGDGGTPNER